MKSKALRADGALFVCVPSMLDSLEVKVQQASQPFLRTRVSWAGWEGNMKLLEKMGSGVVRKTVLGAALIASLAFPGSRHSIG
jgi:hypothetical protein